MAQLFVNNGNSTLSAAIGTGDTTLFIAAGHGSRFPVVSAPDYCFITLEDASGNIEIVKVTAHTSGNTSMTVVRAQQGTTARSFSIGGLVELRATAAEMTAWEADIDTLESTRVQKAGDTYTGTHDFSGASGVTLPAATSIGNVSATEIGYLDGVTSAVQTQLNGKADTNGENYTGTHDFSGAVAVTAPTKAPGSTGNHVATVDYANALAFSSALPGLAGNALKNLQVNAGETSAEWAEVIVYGGRSPRTSNTILGAGDLGKLIDITSGTFTQTFGAASTLGPNWWCYIRNSGTGDITLDPNASELIDSLTSYVMYPGETRLVTCTGTGFFTIVLTGYYRTFTSSGTWIKPPGYAAHSGLLWGGGGGGARATLNNVYTGGGGGGACCPFSFDSNSLAATVTVTIGSGGAATTTAGTYAGTGGQSQFHTATAYGGGGAYALASGTAEGGGGGGILSAGANGTNANALVMGGGPVSISTGSLGPNALHNTGFGGGCAWTTNAGDSAYGGGAGGNAGGKSIYGGGGGSGHQSNPGGTSVFGGAGGTGFYSGSGNATSPGIPAGGGGSVGGAGTGAPSAGARGELRIWGVL